MAYTPGIDAQTDRAGASDRAAAEPEEGRRRRQSREQRRKKQEAAKEALRRYARASRPLRDLNAVTSEAERDRLRRQIKATAVARHEAQEDAHEKFWSLSERDRRQVREELSRGGGGPASEGLRVVDTDVEDAVEAVYGKGRAPEDVAFFRGARDRGRPGREVSESGRGEPSSPEAAGVGEEQDTSFGDKSLDKSFGRRLAGEIEDLYREHETAEDLDRLDKHYQATRRAYERNLAKQKEKIAGLPTASAKRDAYENGLPGNEESRLPSPEDIEIILEQISMAQSENERAKAGLDLSAREASVTMAAIHRIAGQDRTRQALAEHGDPGLGSGIRRAVEKAEDRYEREIENVESALRETFERGGTGMSFRDVAGKVIDEPEAGQEAGRTRAGRSSAGAEPEREAGEPETEAGGLSL